MLTLRLSEFVLVTVLVCAGLFVLALLLLLVAVAYSRAKARRASANREKYLDMLILASEGAGDPAPARRAARREVADLAVHLLSNLIGQEYRQLADWLLRWGFEGDAQEWLGSRSAAQRLRGAVLLLLMKGEAAMPATLPLLADPHLRVRSGVARVLGYAGTEAAVPPVLHAIELDLLAPSIGMMSILRIYPRDGAPLAGGMRSDSAPLRRVAAASVGILEMHSLREPVETLLDDPDESVRLAAIETLDRLAAPGSMALLRAALQSADTGERGAHELALIEQALMSCGTVPSEQMLDFDEEGDAL